MQNRRSFLESLAVLGSSLLVGSPSSKKIVLNNHRQQGISRLELISNNLDEQEKFYTTVMELPVIRVNDKKIKIQAGATEIFFSENEIYTDPIYHFAFNISENKLEESRTWLKNKKIPLAKNSEGHEVFDFRNWNAHSVYWQDPAGNILEFIARHNLPTASPEKFSPASVLYASEIGLVVDNVMHEMKHIKDTLDLDPFHGYASNFAAIGNEYNLLIVVEKNRPWLGSTANIPGKTFPVTSILKNGNRTVEMKFKDYPFVLRTES